MIATTAICYAGGILAFPARPVAVTAGRLPTERAAPRTSHLRGQLTLLLSLQIFVAVVLGGPFLASGALTNDRHVYYPLFRDTLHSLNVHGELPWWSPAISTGFPFYYIGLIDWPGRNPLFAAIAVLVWVVGRVGVTITSYVGLYVLYFAFLIPLMLNLSILALARQMLRHPLAVYAVVVLAAFSPGVVFSVSDVGADVTAYGFFFAAALLHFMRKPDRGRFLLLCLPTLAMACSLTYIELFWNVFFVPLLTAAVCLGRDGVTAQARRAFRTVTARQWAALACAIAISTLPTFVTYLHGRDILSSRTGDRVYDYESLRPGTPLEALALSTPGIGFEWTDYWSPTASFDVSLKTSGGRFSSYGYLGLLTLSLACLGLVFGRRYWSVRLGAGIAGGLTILMLSAYSPIFSLLLGLSSPLRAVNHFGDTAFRLGLYALFLLSAGVGMDALLAGRKERTWVLVALFVLSSSASIAWLIVLQRGASSNYLFGLTLALCFLYAVGLARLANARTHADRRFAFLLLLPLFLLDTSTFAFAHERLSLVQAAGLAKDPGPAGIGTRQGLIASGGFLYIRGIDRRDASEAGVEPPLQLRNVRTGASLPAQTAEITRHTYNDASIHVVAPEASRLEWRDAYFPYWRAWVNGREVPIERTSTGMKAAPVPGGASDVVFRFSPTALRILVGVSFLPILAVAVMFVSVRFRHGRRPNPA